MPLPFWAQVALALLLVPVAGLLAYAFVRDAVLGVASRRWPSAVGVLTQLSHDHDPDDNSHRVDVAYRYSVNGRAYEGCRLRFDMRISGGRKAALALLSLGKPGQPVRVYHSVSQPQLSVLRPGLPWQLAYGLGIAVFVGALAWGSVARLLA